MADSPQTCMRMGIDTGRVGSLGGFEDFVWDLEGVRVGLREGVDVRFQLHLEADKAEVAAEITAIAPMDTIVCWITR